MNENHYIKLDFYKKMQLPYYIDLLGTLVFAISGALYEQLPLSIGLRFLK